MKLKKINIVFIFFFIILYALIIYQYQYLKFPNTYTITEWLINYQGGFIRRGLLGEILYFFYKNKIFNLANIFYFLLIFLYSLIIFLYFNLINKLKIDKILLIQLLSPLFLIYPLIEIDIIGRKEIFLILFLLLYVNFFIKNSIKFQLSYIFLSTNLLFFIHEGLIFYFQFFLLIFFISNISRVKNKDLILISILGCLYFIFLIYFTLFFFENSLPHAHEIINSYSDLTFRNLGAFYWIEKDIFFAINKIIEISNLYIVIKFSFVYVAFQVLFFSYVFRTKKIIFFLFICNFLSIPIFLLALDWGRFIYILFNLNLITIICLKYLNLIEYKNIFKNNYVFTFVILFLTFSNPKVTLYERINFLPYKDLFENIINLI